MYRSESLLDNLLIEVDSLTYRVINIKQTCAHTINYGLRERLIEENKCLYERLKEIHVIGLLLEKRTTEKISYSNLLVEKCRRSIAKSNIKRDLFFL